MNPVVLGGLYGAAAGFYLAYWTENLVRTIFTGLKLDNKKLTQVWMRSTVFGALGGWGTTLIWTNPNWFQVLLGASVGVVGLSKVFKIPISSTN